MSKNKKYKISEASETGADALVDNTPMVTDTPVVSEATALDVTSIPLNADSYTCVQTAGQWVLEKAVLKVGLQGVANKDAFFDAVKAEMKSAGVSTYQSSRYKGMEITDEKVKQRIAYVTQNIGGKNPEHRWTLLSVDKTNGIKYVAAPLPMKMVEKIVEETKE